jgi:hypothetical protein
MAVREYLNVRDGRIIRAPRRRTYERRDRVVAAAIASLRERRITLQEFLRMASNYFEDAKGRARKSVLRCGTNLRIQHPFKSINNKNGKGRTRIFTSIAIHLKISFCYKLYFNVVDAAWFSQEGPHVVRQLE